MALFPDKRKPVDIYNPESSTAKAQARMTDVATAPLRFAGRNLDMATEPAQRIAGKTVIPAALAIGGRLASDAEATTNMAARAGLRQAIRDNNRGDIGEFRDAESRVPAPRTSGDGEALAATSHSLDLMPSHSRLPTPRADVVATSPGTRKLGGLPSVRQMPGSGWIRNEETGEQVALTGNGGDIAHYDASGKQIGQVARMKLGGNSGRSNERYSVEGNPEAMRRFNAAVAPGEYGADAIAARALQREQFRERQGYTKLTPLEEMVGRPLDSFDKKQQPEIVKAAIGGMAAKDSSAGLGTERLASAKERLANSRLRTSEAEKNEMVTSLLDEAANTKDPARIEQIDRQLVALGAKQPREKREPHVYFQEEYDNMGAVTKKSPFVYDSETGETKLLRVGGQQDAPVLPSVEKRVKGQKYSNGKGGYAVWDGTGLIPA